MIDIVAMDLVLEAAWKSLIVAGAALLLLALLKRRSAAERACVAHFGMAALLLVPILVVAGPALEVELLAASEPASAPAAVIADTAPVTASAASTEAGAVATARSTLLAEEPLAGPTSYAFLLYLVPASLLLLLTGVAVFRLFSLRRRANFIVEQKWVSALAHAQRRMGIKSGTALLVSQELRSPVSWGVLRPIILLSEDALENPVDAEAIIAHELAHVARSDWLNLLIARIATALFWFNPLVWLLAREGHQLREEAADDAVLRADVRNTDYAALLVGVARHEGKGMLLAANGVAPAKGSLSIRVRRILEPSLRRSPARLAWGSSCAAGALLIAGPLAALTPVAPEAPSAPEAPAMLAAAPAAPAPLAPPLPGSAPAVPAQVAVAVSLAPAAAPAPEAAPLPQPLSKKAPATPSSVAVAVASASATATTNPAVPAVPVPPESLVSMRVHGVTPALAQEYAAAYPRLRNLTADKLVSLKVHNVTPARLREYASLGYGELNCDRIEEWAVHGVTPNFIRGLAEVGFARLSPAQLTEFRIMGVTPGFIRQVQASGLHSLTPQRLVELRIHGSPPGPRPRGGPSPGQRAAPHG